MPLGLGLGNTIGGRLSRKLIARMVGEGIISAPLAPITRQITAAMTGTGTVTSDLLVTKKFSGSFTGDGTIAATLESAYTPAQDPDLFEWWDAQSGVTESGGELTAWVGAVNSETANPPTVTGRPLYGSDTINSLDVLTFRSSDPNYLEIDISSINNLTIYLVIFQDNTRSRLFNKSTANNPSIESGTTGATSSAASSLGTGLNYYKNGVLIGSDIDRITLLNEINVSNCLLTITGLDVSALSNIFIGNRNTLDVGFDGRLGDMIFSTGTDNLTENNEYLIEKYGF